MVIPAKELVNHILIPPFVPPESTLEAPLGVGIIPLNLAGYRTPLRSLDHRPAVEKVRTERVGGGRGEVGTSASDDAATLPRMFRLRCTQRVSKRFKFEADDEDAANSTTHLGDWYANLLNVGRQRWVLCVSERTLLPALILARNHCFPAQLPSEVGVLLLELGVPPDAMRAEVDRMRTVVPGRTRSRQVLGVMNDFAVSATYFLQDGLSSTEAALRVAQAPMKPLGYAAPCDVAVGVLQQTATPGPQ